MIELVTATIARLAVLRMRLNQHVTDVAIVIQIVAKLFYFLFITLMFSLIVDCSIRRISAHAKIPVIQRSEECNGLQASQHVLSSQFARIYFENFILFGFLEAVHSADTLDN